MEQENLLEEKEYDVEELQTIYEKEQEALDRTREEFRRILAAQPGEILQYRGGYRQETVPVSGEKNMFCPYCGFRVNGMRFCGQCGQQVN